MGGTVDTSGTELGGMAGMKTIGKGGGVENTVITQSKNYDMGNSLNALDNRLQVLSEQEMAEQEERDNYELASQKNKLNALQRQQPPKDQDELIQYLIKRLEAAEDSIKVADEVIKSERDMRKQTSKDMKAQI